MRHCSKCGDEKHEDEFQARKVVPSGKSGTCKACANKRLREWRAANRDRSRAMANENAKKNRNRNRVFVYEYLAAHPCEVCGEQDPMVLDFDHAHSKVKGGVCALVHKGVRIERIVDEMAKCSILCANCHRRKTMREYGWFRAAMQENPQAAKDYHGKRITGPIIPNVNT